MDIMGKLAFSIAEATEAGGGSRTMLYEAINVGTLKAKKRGRSTVILAVDLVQYLESLPDFTAVQIAANRNRHKASRAKTR